MTQPHYQDDLVTVHHGDCLDVMATMPDASFHAVVTDPPYALSFMGKTWDSPALMVGQATNLSGGLKSGNAVGYGGTANQMHLFQQWCTQWAAECLRVLKPGAHLLAFGGTRTWHRLAVAIEDAGFEIRDSIAWLYGSGFPKSLDVSKAIDRAAGAERVVTGEGAPFGSGSLRNRSRVEQGYRPTELRPDGGRVAVTSPATPDAERWQGWGTALKPAFEPIVVARKPLAGTVAQTVLAHGTGALNVDGCRVGETVETWPSSRGPNRGTSMAGGVMANRETGMAPAGRWPTNVVLDDTAAAELDRQAPDTGGAGKASGPTLTGESSSVARGRFNGVADTPFYGDSGGASRFFPTFRYEAKAPTEERPRAGGVAHPTVKPLDLMRWLVRLVTPPGGTVLDPFAGSGTTAEACVIEGFRCVTIEREADYLPLILARLTKPIEPVLDLGALA